MDEEQLYPSEEEPLPVIEPTKEEEEDEIEDLSDMFEVPKKQSLEKDDLSDLVTITDEEEDELVGVDEADIIGEEEAEEPEPEPEEEKPHWSDEDLKEFEERQRLRKARKPVIRRTAKPFIPPPVIGGTR